MIPMELFALEHQNGDDSKDRESDDLLNDFELKERERASAFTKSNSVGGNHEDIFNQGDSP